MRLRLCGAYHHFFVSRVHFRYAFPTLRSARPSLHHHDALRILVGASHGTSWYSDNTDFLSVQQSLVGSLDSVTWTVSDPTFVSGKVSCTFQTNPSSQKPPCQKDIDAFFNRPALGTALVDFKDGFRAFGSASQSASIAVKTSAALLFVCLLSWCILLLLSMGKCTSSMRCEADTAASTAALLHVVMVLCSLAAYGACTGALVAYVTGVAATEALFLSASTDDTYQVSIKE